jgi:hypothetical protein
MQIIEMYQSWCDVDFDLIWRDATESTLVNLEWNRKKTTVLWKQMIAIWRMIPVAYRKAEVSLQRQKKGAKDTEGGTYQDMESKLEKQTYILGRAKGELSGHSKKRTSRDTHRLERAEVGIG